MEIWKNKTPQNMYTADFNHKELKRQVQYVRLLKTIFPTLRITCVRPGCKGECGNYLCKLRG